jgi:hypothetical protein
MPAPLSGPGIGLQLPQNLYPTALQNAPYDFSTNKVALAPGDQLPIPAGDWYISTGFYLVLQFLDPVTGTWVMGSSASYGRGQTFVKSDGFNWRIANLTGCPVGAVVTNQGGGYTQATTTVTVTGGGGSTWQPIVGGALGFSSVVTANAGAGYGVAPIVFIPAPPPASNNANGVGGIQATGYVGISSGTVSGFTFTNVGAGYPTAPVPVVLPNPTDPNINTGITAATLAFTLASAGAITGVLCTNNGAALANPNNFTLTVAGAGTNATLNGIAMQTVTTASVTGAGTGYGTTNVLLTTVGGVPPTGTITNPDLNHIAWLPRPAQVGLAPTGAGGTVAAQAGTIYDGGLFVTNAVPGFVTAYSPITATTLAIVAATISLTMGGATDIATLQPAP